MRFRFLAIPTRVATPSRTKQRSHSGVRSTTALTLLACLLSPIGVVDAFDELTDAQALIYNHPHLQNTQAGDSIRYKYRSIDADSDGTAEDHVDVHVRKQIDDEKRDISIDFLSDERKLILPDFNAYRGNPVIIAMLEHSAQSLGEKTGGGTLYFRNRIRNRLADNIVIEKGKSKYNSQEIETKTIRFKPLLDDVLLSDDETLREIEYIITFSEEVPGGVLGITIDSTREDGEVRLRNELILQNADGE